MMSKGVLSVANSSKKVVTKLEDLHFVNYFTRNLVADPVEENALRQVPGAMFSYVNPTRIFQTTHVKDADLDDEEKKRESALLDLVSKHWDLVAFSKDAALDCLHLQVPDDVLNNKDHEEHKKLLSYLSGSHWLPDDQTRYYAHAYSGHQFGHFASQLGDGRAISLGQIETDHENEGQDHLWELQLKGAGLTPFSRRADGRAVLRSSVREFLASEAMHHLGIPTTRALSLVKSHEKIVPRDEFYNWNVKMEHSAIVLRMAPSFVRFGSFEHFFYRYKDVQKRNKEWLLIDELMNYVIKYHFPELLNGQSTTVVNREVRKEFLNEVVKRTAQLYAKWQTVGFTHGVLNTDNNSILGLTIDYGPYGFMDFFDPDFVPNHSDSEGRYSYSNQPQIGQWNCDKLVYCLSPSFFDFSENGEANKDETSPNYKPPMSAESFRELRLQVSELYWNTFNSEYIRIMRNKLGLKSDNSQDVKLVEKLFNWMTESGADMTNFFRNLSELKKDKDMSEQAVVFDSLCAAMPVNLESHQQKLKQWLEEYMERLTLDKDFSDEDRKTLMNKTNPKFILRNWMAHESILKARTGDYSQVNEIYELLLTPFDEQSEEISQKYARNAPEWAKALKCSCSS